MLQHNTTLLSHQNIALCSNTTPLCSLTKTQLYAPTQHHSALSPKHSSMLQHNITLLYCKITCHINQTTGQQSHNKGESAPEIVCSFEERCITVKFHGSITVLLQVFTPLASFESMRVVVAKQQMLWMTDIRNLWRTIKPPKSQLEKKEF